MKNLKMFAIGLVAFAAMTMGVHAATGKASYVDKDGVTKSDSTIKAVLEGASNYSKQNDNMEVTVTVTEGDITESVATNDITIEGNVKLDLGDYKVTLSTYRIVVDGGTLTITGTDGKATLMNTTSDTCGTLIKLAGDDSHLIVEKGVTIDNKSNNGGVGAIALFADGNHANNSSITISGTVKSAGGIAVSVRGEIKTTSDKKAPVVKITDGAVIDSEKTGYYQAGYAIATIGKATITGTNGVSVKSGSITFNGSTVTGTADYVACPTTSSNGSTYVTGAAVQIEGNDNYSSPAKVTFNGGTYTSEDGSAVMACAYTEEALAKESKINNGEFISAEDEDGEVRPGIELAFYSSNSDENIEWINDLAGFVVKGTFNGPVVGDAKIGTDTNTSMTAPTLLAKLTNGASVVTGDDGSVAVNGGSTSNTPSDEQKPNTGDTANTPSDSKNPQTGDSIMTYMGLGIASIAVVGLGAKNLRKTNC